MLIVVRGLEKGSNDLPRWACPLCQTEQRHYQGFKTLHKHLYEIHAERLVHMTSIAYLAAFWSGSIVLHMCLRMMDRLDLHLEPNQSLDKFKSRAPPRPSWWPANDPEYFNEELTLDPWVSVSVGPVPMDIERASGPLLSINEGFEEPPEAGMARSRSEEALDRGRPSRQSIDNSHPAIRGRQPESPSSMQQLLGRLDPDRQVPASGAMTRRSWPAALGKPPRHPNRSPEKSQEPHLGPQEPAHQIAEHREPFPQVMPGIELPSSMEELGLFDPYQESDPSRPMRPPRALSDPMQTAQQAKGFQAMQRSRSVQQGLVDAGGLEEAEMPSHSGHGGHLEHQLIDLTASEALSDSSLPQRSYKEALSRIPAHHIPMSPDAQPSIGQPKLKMPGGHATGGAASQQSPGLAAWHTAMPALPDEHVPPPAAPTGSHDEPIDLDAEPAAAADTGVEHSYLNLVAAQMQELPLKDKYAKVIKSFDQAALGMIVAGISLKLLMPSCACCIQCTCTEAKHSSCNLKDAKRQRGRNKHHLQPC